MERKAKEREIDVGQARRLELLPDVCQPHRFTGLISLFLSIDGNGGRTSCVQSGFLGSPWQTLIYQNGAKKWYIYLYWRKSIDEGVICVIMRAIKKSVIKGIRKK